MRLRLCSLVFAGLVGLLVGCGQSSPDVAVLFIGNSFTHSNDLPGVVEEIAGANDTSIDIDMIAPPGWFLDEHAASAETMEAIESGEYDFVVIQEQSMAPSHAATFTERTAPAARRLSGAAEAAGSEVILFQTWGHVSGNHVVGHNTYESMQTALVSSYGSLAQDLGATVAPVGERWRTSRTELPMVVLYAPDGVHPSSEGTYLAAVTITDTIIEGPLTSFPAVDIDGETAEQIGLIATS